MRGERHLLVLGEFLVRRACRRLPRQARPERYREWAAELPAILDDPQIRRASQRVVRMLAYALDTSRGSARMSVRARARSRGDSVLLWLLLVGGMAGVAWSISRTVQAPGQALSYLQLVWSFLATAYPVSKLAHSTERASSWIAVSGVSAGAAFYLGNAVQHPGDWVNYVGAALMFLLSAAGWLVIVWARARRA